VKLSEVNWNGVDWGCMVQWMSINFFFSNYVLRWKCCIVIIFLQLDTWFVYLIWIGILCVLCCVSCVVLFFCVMVQFSVLLYSFSVLLSYSVLLYCSLLFILLCSSSCYVCVFDCIYRTLTLPPGVNPIAVNKYLSLCWLDSAGLYRNKWRAVANTVTDLVRYYKLHIL
jgi:hypothetical protein